MNKPATCESNQSPSQIEDLTVNETAAAAVKGGPNVARPQCGLVQKFSGGDIEGEVTTLP
jgi:hypothetical protein